MICGPDNSHLSTTASSASACVLANCARRFDFLLLFWLGGVLVMPPNLFINNLNFEREPLGAYDVWIAQATEVVVRGVKA